MIDGPPAGEALGMKNAVYFASHKLALPHTPLSLSHHDSGLRYLVPILCTFARTVAFFHCALTAKMLEFL